MPQLRRTAATVLVVLAVALVLVACSSPAATPDPTADPTADLTANATATAGAYTDAEQADILAENIDRMYAEDTQFTWYPAFVELTVEDGWAYVTTTMTESDADLADSACRDIAAAAFENFIEPIGVMNVRISGGGGDLVDCEVPES